LLRQFSTKRIIGFFILDWVSSLGMLLVATILRAEIGRLPDSIINLMDFLHIQSYGFWGDVKPGELLPWQVFLVVAIIWPFFFLLFSIYDGRRNPNLTQELLNVFLAISISTLTLAGVLYFSYRETPRVLILIFFILDTIMLLGVRLVWGLVRSIQSVPVNAQHRAVIIVGAGPVGQNAVQQLKKYAWKDIDIIGYLDDDPSKQGKNIEGAGVLGTLNQAEGIVRSQNVQDAIVALPLRAHKTLVEICQTLQKLSIHVHVIPDLFALSFPSSTLDGFGGIPVIDLGKPGIHGFKRAAKRAFDLVAVSICVILLSPVFLIITIIIILDSKGPAFYKQPRIGEHGQSFLMYKFRSMYVDSDPEIHKNHVTRLIQQNLDPNQLKAKPGSSLKLESDPRVTPFGKFIRKFSVDELPQLINVLRGEMSLVGPRPPLLYEVELYKDWHRRRFEVPPGITGLWQVHGRNMVSFDEMVRMDLEYIEHQSLWLDFKLLLQTPRAVLTTRGAG
jgi:exopolysaccharide biosynthesis polyprenyl glycosylphosphotransferase